MIKQLYQVIRKQLSSDDANSGILNTQSNSAKPSIFERLQVLKKSPQSKAAKLEQAKQDYLNQAQPSLLQELEPRFMFDGAAIETVDLADGVSQDEQAYVLSAINDNDNAYAADSLLAAIEADSEGFAADYSQFSEVIIIDARVKDPHVIINSISRDAAVEVILPEQNGVDKIAELLQKYQSLDAIHIVSHGDTAQLQLGDVNLNASNLTDYQAQLQQWGQALTDTGDILFYGCNVAEGDQGQAFVDQLKALTSADIAASIDITGGELVDGDSILEESQLVEADEIIDLEHYNHQLEFTQRGVDIVGENSGDWFGDPVAINEDGTRVVIGGSFNDEVATNAGHARVYEYSDGSWEQMGADIDGENANDYFGEQVSINADGTIVAIGSRLNDDGGYNVGYVKIYQWDTDTLTWNQMGTNIVGEAVDDQSGCSLSLSSDGTRVAIGANRNDGNGTSAGHVRIYEWDTDTLAWNQMGADIDGEAAIDESGFSVSLSADGNRVAIGAPYNDGSATCKDLWLEW